MRSSFIATALAVATIGLPAAVIADQAIPTATRVEHPISFSEETKVRQHLLLVALGREPADLIIRGATVLNVFTSQWDADQDIVIQGKRIAWVGPEGQW